jgi:NADPH:quinone reductase-like Zn-dependent oxidoreductase
MKALIFKKYGRADQVVFADIPRPALKPREILVQVHAAGLNAIDTMIPKGTFKPMLKFQLPATLGSDLAGVVVEAGNRVTRFKPGDAVFASIFDLGTGALAEFAVVPENAAAHKPANLDFVQAASIPMVGLTSWQALKERAKLKPGQAALARSQSSLRKISVPKWGRQRARGTWLWSRVSEQMR